MKRHLFILFVILISSNIFAQNLPDVYKKVEKKLDKDSKYLDIYSIPFTPTPEELPYLKNIPVDFGKNTVSFDDKHIYNIVFIKETIEIDSVVLLYVYTVNTSGGIEDNDAIIDMQSSTTYDTVKVLKFSDVQELYFDKVNRKFYNELYRIVLATMQEQEPKSLLGIKIDESLKKSKGYSGENNKDFVNYMFMNSLHKYPKKKAANVVRRGREKTTKEETDFSISASLNHCTFTHKIVQFPYYMLGAEINFGDDFLNVVPYENMTTSFGVRGLITFSEKELDIEKDIILDIKLMGKTRVDFSGAATRLSFIFTEKPKLNVNSGVSLDITTSSLYHSPFMNLYVSFGSNDFSNPYVKFGKRDSSWSYFTSTQWRYLFSFYWNATEKAEFRLKMDIGLGAHNIVKAIQYKRKYSESLMHNKLLPIFGFNLAFVPRNSELINLGFRYYDNIVKGELWFKVVEFDEHLFRIGGVFLSGPLFRKTNEWENDGGGMMQIHYRYGF
jgi:hypothetical protein